MVDENLYYTQSWNVAAWFLHKDIPIEFNIINEKGMTFYFKRSERTKTAMEEYNKNQELKDFIYCYKKIKDRVKQDRLK